MGARFVLLNIIFNKLFKYASLLVLFHDVYVCTYILHRYCRTGRALKEIYYGTIM